MERNGIQDLKDIPTDDELNEFILNIKIKDIINPHKNDTCSICLDIFNPEDSVVLLVVCGHVFHENCIMDWLKKKYSCPNCKYEIRKSKKEEAIKRKNEIQNRPLNQNDEAEVFFMDKEENGEFK